MLWTLHAIDTAYFFFIRPQALSNFMEKPLTAKISDVLDGPAKALIYNANFLQRDL